MYRVALRPEDFERQIDMNSGGGGGETHISTEAGRPDWEKLLARIFDQTTSGEQVVSHQRKLLRIRGWGTPTTVGDKMLVKKKMLFNPVLFSLYLFYCEVSSA